MKKTTKEITTKKTVYVSVDGKEFENEADCKAWETSYVGTLTASWKNIKKFEVCDCDLGLPWSCDDHECYVIKPKDLNEIVLINAYIKATTGDDRQLTTEHIGKVISMNFGYDHDFCDIYVMEDYIKKITDYVATLANKLEEEAK